MFNITMKLADVVRANYNTLNVINRFGIKLGFGDMPVSEVCERNGLDPNFFVEILNAFHNKDYFPHEHLQHFSVPVLVNYLRMTHQEYIQKHIPFVQKLLDELDLGCTHPDELKLVHNLFDEYKDELFKHLQWEDEEIFPYALEVERALDTGEGAEEIVRRVKSSFSMKNYLEGHTDIESKINDINAILVKYLAPVNNQFLCIRILKELAMLEQDINSHCRMEDKVLTPKVIRMEKKLLEQYG